jgi:hypothetical protein
VIINNCVVALWHFRLYPSVVQNSAKWTKYALPNS